MYSGFVLVYGCRHRLWVRPNITRDDFVTGTLIKICVRTRDISRVVADLEIVVPRRNGDERARSKNGDGPLVPNKPRV